VFVLKLPNACRKRAAPEDELQTPQRKVAKNQASSFLKAASDQMKSCKHLYLDTLLVTQQCCCCYLQFIISASPAAFKRRTWNVAGIQWGGILEVKFTICVEPGVFNKVFDGCPRLHAADKQEPGEMPEPGELVVVNLDRDEMLRVFGKVSI